MSKGSTRCRWGESKRLAYLSDCQPNRCFGNCYKIVKSGYDAVMVRGRVRLGDVQEDHVWLERDGWIIDPTIALVREPGESYSYQPTQHYYTLPSAFKFRGMWIPGGDFFTTGGAK